MPDEPLFVARESYRRRRLGDAARLAPFVGVVLMMVPVLWPIGTRTAGGLIYVFAVWAVLILAIGLVAGRLQAMMTDGDKPDDPGETER